MKRGRPAMREEFRSEILNVLDGSGYPVTATTVKRLLDAKRGQRCGWDTVRKYLEDLTAERLVLRQVLPTNRGRKPLVLYMGRHPQYR